MTIDKLPSGSYRCRVSYNGKRYSKVLDHKPTKAEMQVMFVDKYIDTSDVPNLTLQDACRSYIESKENVLSPSTIRGYEAIVKRIDPVLMHSRLCNISQNMLQQEVNRIAKDHSPKTVYSHYAFINAVLSHFNVKMDNSPTLPQKCKNEPYIPSDEDIKQFLSYCKPEYEILIRLLCCGLRLSEACALTVDDLDGNTIHITKAKVYGPDSHYVLKTTKTTESTRDVDIPKPLADMIRERGYIYEGHPKSVDKYMRTVQKEHGIPYFSPHKLRHYFCSKCIDLGLDITSIQKLGGWSSPNTINKVYAHMMREKEKRSLVTDALTESLFS